jgi:hypothetical protein
MTKARFFLEMNKQKSEKQNLSGSKLHEWFVGKNFEFKNQKNTFWNVISGPQKKKKCPSPEKKLMFYMKKSPTCNAYFSSFLTKLVTKSYRIARYRTLRVCRTLPTPDLGHLIEHSWITGDKLLYNPIFSS